MPHELFERYAPLIAALPQEIPLGKSELQADCFLLHTDGKLAIYYAPFGYVNQQARVALVGITPGWTQMEIAFRVARDGLHKGLPYDEILRQAKSQASFAGSMRKNLCLMLDGIGVPERLGIQSSASLFGEHCNLAHTTSTVRYPVFKAGANYTGRSPSVVRNQTLLRYVTTYLRSELAIIPQALVIALGDCVAQALSVLIENGDLDPDRCLLGFPHPSGANGHRQTHFQARQDQLTRKVQAWFSQERVAHIMASSAP